MFTNWVQVWRRSTASTRITVLYKSTNRNEERRHICSIIKLISGRGWWREMKRENTISDHWSARIRWWTRYWHWSVGAASVSIIILVWWPPRIGIIRRNWWSIKNRRTIRWHSHVHWRRWWSWSTIWRIRSIRQLWLHWPQCRFLSDQIRKNKN